MAKKAMGSFRQRAAKMKDDLLKRHQEAAERTEERSEFESVFDKEKVPEGVGFWRPGKGQHVIDLIPFFAGKQDPRNPEGRKAYVVDFYVHNRTGPENVPVVCLKRNYDKRCPICEHINKSRLPKSEWEMIKPKRRTAYLVWVHDELQKEEKKGIQIWEVAHWFFEKHIDELAKKPRGGGYVQISHEDVGRSIAFKIKQSGSYEDADGTKRESIEFSGHQLLEREEKIPDEILDSSFSLDECLKIRSFEEIEDLLQSDVEEEVVDEEKQEESGEDEQQDDEVEDEPGEETVDEEPDEGDDLAELDRTDLKRLIKDEGLDVKVFKNDSDDDIREKIREARGTEPEDEDVEDEPEDEEVQEDGDDLDELDRNGLKKLIIAEGLKDSVKVFKNDTEDDIREKIREARGTEDSKPTKPKGKGGECPAGGTFGKDTDEYEACLECAIYDQCSKGSGN